MNFVLQEAFHRYRQSLQALLPCLQEPGRSAIHHTRLESQFTLAKNCLERMQALTQVPFSEERTDSTNDYLQVALSSNASQRASGEGRASSSAGDRSSPPARNPTGSASRTFSLSLAQHQPARSPPMSVDTSLSNMRKIHENALLARQLSQHKTLLQGQSSASVAKRDAFVRDLLGRRQRLYARVNVKFNDLFQNIWSKARDISVEIKAAYENESRRRSLRHAIGKMSRKEENEFFIIEPVVELLSSRTNPIGMLLCEFLSRWRQLLRLGNGESEAAMSTFSSFPSSSSSSFPSSSAAALKVMEEVGFVEHHLVELFQETFEELADPSLVTSLKVSIQHYLFSTFLSQTLLCHLRRLHARRDLNIVNCFLEMGWQDLFSRLSIPSKLQLPRDRPLDAFPIHEEGLYARAIEELRTLSTATTPTGKLVAMMQACNSICQAIEEYFREQSNTFPTGSAEWNPSSPLLAVDPFPQEAALGSEDLLLLCAYAQVRSCIPDLASQLFFVSELAPEELIRGEAGYVLATMQTSLEYLLSLEN